MRFEVKPKVVTNFFLDGAKIIFGSLVVGMFVPSVAPSAGFPWLTIATGVGLTVIFLSIANFATEKEATNQSSRP